MEGDRSVRVFFRADRPTFWAGHVLSETLDVELSAPIVL